MIAVSRWRVTEQSWVAGGDESGDVQRSARCGAVRMSVLWCRLVKKVRNVTYFQESKREREVIAPAMRLTRNKTGSTGYF